MRNNGNIRRTSTAKGTYANLYKNRNRRKANAPVLIGKVELNNQQLEYLDRQINHGNEAKLQCAAWKNKDERTGEEHLTLMLTIPQHAPVSDAPDEEDRDS